MYSLEQTCGINNSDGNFSEVNADGILIFVNDPNFTAVQLWNKFNNTVYVNSYEECEHYFLGGFNSTPMLNVEIYSRTILIVFLIAVVFIKRLKNYKK